MTQAAAIQRKMTLIAHIRRVFGLTTPAGTASGDEAEAGLLAILRGHGYGPSDADPFVWVPCRMAATR